MRKVNREKRNKKSILLPEKNVKKTLKMRVVKKYINLSLKLESKFTLNFYSRGGEYQGIQSGTRSYYDRKVVMLV